MRFIELCDLSWINLDFVHRIYVYQDTCKYEVGSPQDTYRWKVAVQDAKGNHVWEEFRLEQDAHDFLDGFLQEQING